MKIWDLLEKASEQKAPKTKRKAEKKGTKTTIEVETMENPDVVTC